MNDFITELIMWHAYNLPQELDDIYAKVNQQIILEKEKWQNEWDELDKQFEARNERK